MDEKSMTSAPMEGGSSTLFKGLLLSIRFSLATIFPLFLYKITLLLNTKTKDGLFQMIRTKEDPKICQNSPLLRCSANRRKFIARSTLVMEFSSRSLGQVH